MQTAVVNIDDPAAQTFLDAARAVQVVTYSYENAQADVYCQSVDGTLWENELIVVTPQGRLQIITNLLGRNNICNILAAVATGIALKVRTMGQPAPNHQCS